MTVQNWTDGKIQGSAARGLPAKHADVVSQTPAQSSSWWWWLFPCVI